MAGILPPPRLKFTDQNGKPLVGGKVYTYFSGTSRAAPTFTDFTASTKNANPVILDGNGECDIWFDGLIKVRLEDADGQEIWTRDNLSSIQESITLPLREHYTGDGTTVTYDVSDLNASSVETMLVTVNDLLKEPGIDYTLDTAAGTMTFTAAPADESKIVIRTFGLASTFNFLARTEVQIATASQAVFTLANAYSPGTGGIQVYLNSARMFPDAYTETNEKTITFSEPLDAGDKLMFVTSEIIGSATKIIDGSVTEQKIAAGAVTTTRLANNAVTEPKMADASVSSRTIVAGAVGNSAIGSGAVTAEKLGGSLIGGIAVTGDWSFQYSSIPRAGTVWANGETIGDASSGATNRANIDTHDLFVFLWNNHSQAVCPVIGGRGIAAEDDWVAHRRITLPDSRDMVMRFWGAGPDDPGRVIGTRQEDALQGFDPVASIAYSRDRSLPPPPTGTPYSNGGGGTLPLQQSWDATASSADSNGLARGYVISDGVNGTPRMANETRVKNLSAGIACLKL